MIFLITFTHYPAVQTVISSFFSTARGRRKSIFIGWDNYTNLLADEVFWKVLTNNFWYAVWTIPLSIILSLAMALWVNDKLRGRGFFANGIFHSNSSAIDCSRQYLVVLLYTRVWPDRSNSQFVWLCWTELDGVTRHGLIFHDRCSHMERSRIFHDFLLGGTSDDSALFARGRVYRGRE